MDHEGECAPVACRCMTHYSPVCGVNGVKYRNECFALCDSITIDYVGCCRCPFYLVYAPVCGVNGLTYDSPCAADCADVEVAHDGAC